MITVFGKTVEEVLAEHQCWLAGDPKASRAHLRFYPLDGYDFTKLPEGTCLDKVDFGGTAMRNSRLSGLSCRGACFKGAALRGADLSYGDFTGCDCYSVNLDDADCSYADFRKADLGWGSCENTKFIGARFDGACITCMDFPLVGSL